MKWSAIRTWTERTAWACAVGFVLTASSCIAQEGLDEHVRTPGHTAVAVFFLGLGLIAAVLRARATDEYDGPTHSHGPA